MSKVRPHCCKLLSEVNLELSIYEGNHEVLIECLHHTIGYNVTASANGTALVPLNIASNDFLAGLNLNYDASDGSPQKIVSPWFNVNDSQQARAVTWSQGALADLTLSPSAVSQTSISASLLTSSASTPSAASSTLSISKPSSTLKSSSTSDSQLGTRAIVGIVVGIIFCVGLAASLVFYRRRRKPKRNQAEIINPPSADFQSSIPVTFIGEKDGTPLRPPELSGDGQVVEMATSHHEDMNVSTGRA